jgi:AsmA protein
MRSAACPWGNGVSNSELAKSVKPGKVYLMRRKNVLSRFATLALATVACLLLAVLAPMLSIQRTSDEPFSGYAVMASPRDMHAITAPIRLSDAPDLTLNRGTLYADGNVALGTPISRFVLDGPVFYLNASGLRTSASGFEASYGSMIDSLAPLLVDQLTAMGFDALTLRRGTLYVTGADGSWETISEIQAELTGRRKGQISGRGSFTIRGQRLAFDATLAPGTEKRNPPRWPTKLTLKGDLLEASFEGHLDVGESLQLSGQAELSTPSVRRGARWFGVPVPSSEGLNAATIKGQINWARHTLAFEDARVTLDGNEASGALVLHVGGDRPLIDGTLAFNALDLTPYVEAARSQSFLFDRQTASWSTFDLSLPLIRHIDADLRISAPKVAVKGHGLGRGAATITVRAGKLLADIAELELYSGKVGVQVSVNANELVPRYTLRGKVENFEAGYAATALFGAAVLTGRSTLSLDLAAAGQTPAELVRGLSGKVALAMTEGGRVGLDIKALRAAAKADGPPGWGPLAKGQTGLEQIEARALVRDGVLITETVRARSGAGGVVASGRVDLAERTLDLHLSVKPYASADKPVKPTDILAAEAVRVRGFWQEPFVRSEEPGADSPP